MDAGRQEKEEGGKQSGIQLDHNRPKSGIIQMGKITGVDLEGGSNSNTIYCKGWFVKKKFFFSNRAWLNGVQKGERFFLGYTDL